MADFTAQIVLTFPAKDGTPVKKGHLLEANSMADLKHQLYLLAFNDVYGENDATLRQWKADNQIRTK